MRVTTDMIFDRTMFNLSRNIQRYMRVESMLSSGRRINAPSDDPIGTQHDLNYRSRLSEMSQHLSNISQGMGWMTSYENGLADVKDMYSAVKEIAITMANDTNNDEVTRIAAANEIESILEQVLQVANAKIDSRYVYAGHRTHTEPLRASANGVIYQGDRGIIEMEMDVSSRIASNFIGEDVFLNQFLTLGEDANLETGVTAATLLSDLNMGNGVDLSTGTFEITDNNRGINYTIDLTGAVTVGDAVTMINAQLGVGSNLEINISEAGASLEWNPAAPTTNTIALNTPLKNLNGGDGVDTNPGTFIFTNADSSISVEVDLSSATTVGDVLTIINTTLLVNGVSGITMGYNADGTGFRVNDGNSPPLGLSIVESSDAQSTAYDLGILGDLDPAIEGRDISPKLDFIIRDIGTQTTGADLGILGTVDSPIIGQNIRPLLTLDTALSSLNNKVGFDFGQLKISQGDQIAIVDLDNATITTIADVIAAINSSGLEISASINDAGTGIQIEPTVSGKTLIIESNDSSKTAHSLGIAGSSDMLGSLMLLANALRNDDRELILQLNGNMDLAINELLSTRADVGAKMIRMETTRNRLEATQINVTRLLSEVEDADIISLVSELGREENLYQASLVASSKLMQMSLMDFLR